ARPSGAGRGVWLALGAVLGVGVLIAAGVYIPRRMGTHADPSKAVFTANSGSTASSAAPTPGTPSPGDTTTTPNAPVVSLQSDQGSLQVGPDGNVSMTSPKGSIHVDANTGSVRSEERRVGKECRS